MASLRIILRELDKTCVLLQRQIPAAELEVIASEWLETFARLTDEEFAAALRRYRRACRYWPTEADILKAHDELKPDRPPVLAALPEAPPDWNRQERNLTAMLTRLAAARRVR